MMIKVLFEISNIYRVHQLIFLLNDEEGLKPLFLSVLSKYFFFGASGT